MVRHVEETVPHVVPTVLRAEEEKEGTTEERHLQGAGKEVGVGGGEGERGWCK